MNKPQGTSKQCFSMAFASVPVSRSYPLPLRIMKHKLMKYTLFTWVGFGHGDLSHNRISKFVWIAIIWSVILHLKTNFKFQPCLFDCLCFSGFCFCLVMFLWYYKSLTKKWYILTNVYDFKNYLVIGSWLFVKQLFLWIYMLHFGCSYPD